MYKVFFKESCFLLTDNQNLLKEGDIRWVHRDFMTTKISFTKLWKKGIPFKAVLYDEDPEDLIYYFQVLFHLCQSRRRSSHTKFRYIGHQTIRNDRPTQRPSGIWRNDGTMCRPGSRRRMRVKTSKYSVSFRHHPPYLLPE